MVTNGRKPGGPDDRRVLTKVRCLEAFNFKTACNLKKSVSDQYASGVRVVRASDLLADGDKLSNSELTAVDATHYRPLAFVLNCLSYYLSCVLDGGQADVGVVPVFEQKSPSPVEIDVELEDLQMLR